MNPEEEIPQTTPVDKTPAREEITSGSQGKVRGPLARPKAVIAVVLLLICIVGGGFLIIQSTRPSSVSGPATTSNTNSSTLSRPWCAPPASLSTNFSGTSISGLAANDVWSVGGPGAQIMHWDGNTWSVAYRPSSAQDILRSIVEVAPHDIWVVGEHVTNGLPSHVLLLHWDGTQWQTVSSTDAAAGGKNALVAVSGTSTNDVWAVGFFVPSRGSIGPLIEHWNGSQWSVMTNLQALGSVQFTSIKALSTSDAWAVGYAYIASPHAGKTITQPITEHWDGKQWHAVTNPNLISFGGGTLYNIGGSSANDLWAVGSVNNGMLTEHWNGQTWSMIASPSVLPDSSNWLASVAASAPDNVWAVGRDRGNGTGFQPFIEHWDGHQWQVMQDPTDNAGELDVVTTIGQQFWIVGIPKADGGHAFIETLCP